MQEAQDVKEQAVCTPHCVGDDIEGTVVATRSSEVFVDLSPYGTGIIFGREYIAVRDILKKLKMGDSVTAKIIRVETEDGYIELSLKEAQKIQLWKDAAEGEKNGVVYTVTVKKTNRGGLVVDWFGFQGFLPFSLLKENGPSKRENTMGSDMSKMIGQKVFVSILEVNPEEERLIFSEASSSNPSDANANRNPTEEEYRNVYNVGDVCSGIVTGVVDFGVFVRFDHHTEGLIHTSEIDWGFVSSPASFFSVGDTVSCKITEIKDGKYSCSVKALKENPWASVGERYKVGDVVPGVVIQYNKHGAFISIEVGVSGLIHKSNFENEEDLQNVFSIGNSYDFKITNLDSTARKIIFVPADMDIAKKKKEVVAK